MTVTQGTYLKGVVTWALPQLVVAQNVFYWQLKGLSPVADAFLVAAVQTGLEAMFDNLGADWSNDAALESFILNEWEYDGEDGWHTGRYVGEDTLTDNFESSTDMLPHAVAATITANTANVKTRSRKSLPGVIDSGANDSILQAPTIAAVVAWTVDWISDMFVDTNEHLEPGVPGLEGIWYPLLLGFLSGVVGSQRRRKPGIGI